MAEGFFHPQRFGVPGVSVDQLCASMVRVIPKTLLVLDIAPDGHDPRSQERNEAEPDGFETWYRFFNREDREKVDDPDFAMRMVQHEFSRLVKAGAVFPATIPLDGGGSGFSISPDGYVLSNFHLVPAEVSNNGRDGGVVNNEVLCKSLRAQVAHKRSDGAWQWQDANAVWLVSNPSFDRALEAEADGLLHPREDTALLRIDPPPQAHLTLSERILDVGEDVWMAGFPIRSARRPTSLQRIGYSNADASLRVSAGQVKAIEADRYFSADLDGSAGNSGSAVFDKNGLVVGIFSRAVGAAQRNATEYGHVNWVQVTTRRLCSCQSRGGLPQRRHRQFPAVAHHNWSNRLRRFATPYRASGLVHRPKAEKPLRVPKQSSTPKTMLFRKLPKVVNIDVPRIASAMDCAFSVHFSTHRQARL